MTDGNESPHDWRNEFDADDEGDEGDAVIDRVAAALRAPVKLNAGVFDARVMAEIRSGGNDSGAGANHRSPKFLLWSGGGALAALAAAATIAVVSPADFGRPERTTAVSTRVAARAAAQEAAQEAARGAPPSPARLVEFRLIARQARRVTVAGNFNGWNTGATPLVRVDRDTWVAHVPLADGRYEYQFVVDGRQWIPDPAAPRDAADEFGSGNSVVTVVSRSSAS